MKSAIGCEVTIAPEIVLLGTNGFESYNEKCDLWSLGVIIYKMVFGEYPYV